MYQTIVEAVLAHAETQPEKLAVAFKQTQLTYRELAKQMKQCAVALKRNGIGSGDMVMLSALSKPEYVVILLGIQYLQAISIPVDKSAKEANILDVYHFIEPKLLLTDTKITDATVKKLSMKEFYAFILEQDSLEAPAYLIPDNMDSVLEMLFTTGTTGKPKGAMLTYSNIFHSTYNTWKGIGMLDTDCVLIPLPLNHSVGMRVLRSALYIGATVVLQNGFTFAKELERNINDYECTGLVSVPASMELVYRQMQDSFALILGKLRYIEVSAGSLSYDMKKKLLSILPNTQLINTWGSTETGGAIFLNVTRNPDKLTSLGKPAEGVELKVVDSEGNTIDAHDIDTAGRMVLRGPMQMAGYYQMPEVTAQTLVDGWLYTNDMVYVDADGFVYMLGRADDIINVGGEKVSPIEVENIAQEYDHIRECACIGVDDPEGILGKIPVLYVVREDNGYEEKELIKFLSTRMEKYKIPQKFLYIDELPRNRMQKLDRKALYRKWEQSGENKLMNEVILNIRNRRSIRDFTDQEIPRDVLDAIVQTAIYAPSGHNMQTWRFTVLQNTETIMNLRSITERIAKMNKVHFYGFNNPKALVLVSNDRRNNDGIQDSSCAAQNMMLAANSLGLGSVWLNPLMSISDAPEIREMLQSFGIPDTHIVWAMIGFGYPVKPGRLLAKKQNVIHWIE